MITRLQRTIQMLLEGDLEDWQRVLEADSRRVSWPDLIRDFLGPKVSRKKARERLEVCAGCPVFDPLLDRCFTVNPESGLELGCGCYLPFRAFLPAPCWLRERDPNLGWD